MKNLTKNKLDIIKNYLHKKFANSNILILGFGREGQSSYQFLKQFLPNKKIIISDQKPITQFSNKKLVNKINTDNHTTFISNKKLPKTITKHTFIFKSPGISPFKKPFSTLLEEKSVEIQSNTNLFLQIIQILKKNEKKTPNSSISKQQIEQIQSQPLATKKKFNLISQDLTRRPFLTIAITGTKGKSTTANTINTTLKDGGLKTLFIGNIGYPPLKYVNRLTNDTKIILELSSHQIIDLQLSTDVIILQEINQDHLDYYPDLKTYHQAKSLLAKHQKVNQYIIYNPKFKTTKKIAKLSKGSHLHLTLEENKNSYMYKLNDYLTFRYINHLPEKIIDFKDIKLLGKHNLYNILPGIFLSKLLEVENQTIRRSIQALKPLPHRLEHLGEAQNIHFYNDSLATTTQATINALKALDYHYQLSRKKGQIILIAGGYERNQNFSQLADQILRQRVKMLFLMSQTAQRLLKSLNEALTQISDANIQKPPHFFIQNFKQAEKIILEKIQNQKIIAHDIMLLSPAAASFNLFKNYKDRGKQFKTMFKNLKEKLENSKAF